LQKKHLGTTARKNTTVAKKNWELLQQNTGRSWEKTLPDTKMVTVANNTSAGKTLVLMVPSPHLFPSCHARHIEPHHLSAA
jgi:hypothetical protein